VRVARQWNRLPREFVEHQSSKIIKTLTGYGQPTVADPALSRGVGLDNLWTSLST